MNTSLGRLWRQGSWWWIVLALAIAPFHLYSPALAQASCSCCSSGAPTCDSVGCCETSSCCQAPANSCQCQCHSCCSLACRDTLLGDWWGIKPHLAASGITVDASLTQFYQGVTQGGGEQRFRYGAKTDVFINADTGKLGLWEGGTFTSHVVDWQFGHSVLRDAAGLAPVNTALLLPNGGDPGYGITSLQFTQQLGGGLAATIGRINILDLWAGFYPNYGRGVDGFMNISALMPLNTIPSLPQVTNGAGIIKAGPRGMESGLLVLDSQNTRTTVGLDFPNGVTFLGFGRKYTNFGCQPGSHTVAFTYATGDYTSFNTQGWIILPPGGVIPAEESGTWAATYLVEQRLWSDCCNQNRYTSAFGYVGFSDAQTSPFACTASVSVESFGPIASRPADRTGIAYFYNALNSDFQDLFSLVTPLNDVHGGEIYYNAEVTPWCHLTLDLQVIDPAIEARDTTVVLGARAKIDF